MVFPPLLLLTTMEAGYVARGTSVQSRCGCYIPVLLHTSAIVKASSTLDPPCPKSLKWVCIHWPTKGFWSLTWKCRFSYRNLKSAVCCLLFQSPASPTDGSGTSHAPLAGLLSRAGHPCPDQRDFGGPSSFPWAFRVHAGLPKGAVCVGLSSCTGTERGRG